MDGSAPGEAHDVFIREALVGDRLGVDAPFVRHNRALIEDVAGLEHKARREDVLVDEDAIAAFYAERIPGDVLLACGVRANGGPTPSAPSPGGSS